MRVFAPRTPVRLQVSSSARVNFNEDVEILRSSRSWYTSFHECVTYTMRLSALSGALRPNTHPTTLLRRHVCNHPRVTPTRHFSRSISYVTACHVMMQVFSEPSKPDQLTVKENRDKKKKKSKPHARCTVFLTPIRFRSNVFYRSDNFPGRKKNRSEKQNATS